MFLSPSSKIDHSILSNSYESIKLDYFNFLNKEYFFDYNYDNNLTCSNVNNKQNIVLPKSTGYFWQVCPLIYNKEIIPIVPGDIRECFTSKLLMSFDVKPVLSVFSMLEPNSEITPHIDRDYHIPMSNGIFVNSTIVKYHFSLDIPDGECGLFVGGENRILKDKDLNIFDESSTHFAYNKSNKRRGVLISSYIRSELY